MALNKQVGFSWEGTQIYTAKRFTLLNGRNSYFCVHLSYSRVRSLLQGKSRFIPEGLTTPDSDAPFHYIIQQFHFMY